MAVAVVSVPVKKRSKVEHSRFSSWKHELLSPLNLEKSMAMKMLIREEVLSRIQSKTIFT